MGKLAKALKSSSFVVTSELTPPKGTDLDELFAKADLLRDRVQRLGLVSALGPTHLSGDADPMRGLFRMVVGVADRAPDLMENVLNLVARGLIKNPDKHLRRFVTFTSPADAPVFAQQRHRDAYVKAVKEAYRNGCQGFVEDLRAVARAPEPDAASLTMPNVNWVFFLAATITTAAD